MSPEKYAYAHIVNIPTVITAILSRRRSSVGVTGTVTGAIGSGPSESRAKEKFPETFPNGIMRNQYLNHQDRLSIFDRYNLEDFVDLMRNVQEHYSMLDHELMVPNNQIQTHPHSLD